MRATVTVALIAVILAAVAYPALADHIGFYDTPNPVYCLGPTPPPQTLGTYYVVHLYSPGSLGSRWGLTVSPYLLLISFTCGGVSIPGDPAVGLTVSYPGCTVGSFVACTFTFFNINSGPFADCSHVRVVPHLDESNVLSTDCAGVDKVVTGGAFSFDDVPWNCDNCLIATDQTTWGAVKALYR